MRCARLNLQERPKSEKSNKQSTTWAGERPRRFCQQRMVDPDAEQDPRWTKASDRFHCDKYQENNNETSDSHRNQEEQDLYLTVQTLKFEGDAVLPRRPKSCFKYKTPTDRTKHRLFIKQTIDDVDQDEEDRTSALSSYYYNDYANYLQNADKSRPTSTKSNHHQNFNKVKQNKSTQVDLKNVPKPTKPEKKIERHKKVIEDSANKENDKDNLLNSTKVCYRKSGKRKSLTISRTPSPETVQVIRVDVVCNRTSSCSTMTDYDDVTKIPRHDNQPLDTSTLNVLGHRQANFYNKYLFTNTIKSLDHKLSGSKVTLLCKTFRLSDRSKTTADGNKRPVNTNQLHAGNTASGIET